LRSSHGAGSRVAVPAGVPARPDAEPDAGTDVLDLTVAALPAPALLLDAVQKAAVALHPLLAGHGLHPLGVPALREAVALHLSSRGLATRSDQVLVTNGALHGWDLLLRALARPGERVLVEQPTYPAVLDALAAHRLRPVALPVTARGWDLPPAATRLAHVTPDAQNPTGLLASDAQRKELVHALRGVVVAVDETFADLVIDGIPPRPMAAFHRSIVTLGSMSKAFWAGLRVGWVRAEPDLLARLAQARAGQDLASPVLEQLVAAELLGRADAILPERRELLGRSRDALVSALARELPAWRCSAPPAGMVVWVELPSMSATRLAAHALDMGVRLTSGPRFTVRGTADRWLRLPFTLPAERMDEVAALLREAAARTQAGTTPIRPASRWTA
ncbi:MAG: PLP-dependent aminotransferase family protein, partial [Actinomycetota bacterium]|nr:PLP-dependent aminotransferase family protein [Actinomycetota bacterium]